VIPPLATSTTPRWLMPVGWAAISRFRESKLARPEKPRIPLLCGWHIGCSRWSSKSTVEAWFHGRKNASRSLRGFGRHPQWSVGWTLLAGVADRST